MRPFLSATEVLEMLHASGISCVIETLRAAERESAVRAWRTERGDLLFSPAAAVAVRRAIEVRRDRRTANLRKWMADQKRQRKSKRKPERSCR